MKRDSLVFYRSFMEATDNLDPEQYKKTLQMLLHYAMDGEQPEVEGIEYSLFSLMKPQIDANNRKYENGKKGAKYGKLGGRPKKETPNQDNINPTKTPNVNEECINANVNEECINANVNEECINANGNENKRTYGEYQKVKLTDDEYVKLSEDYGEVLRDKAIKYLDEYIMEKSYNSKSHNIAIRRWVINAVKEQETKNQRQANNTTYKKQSVSDHLEDFYTMAADWAKE